MNDSLQQLLRTERAMNENFINRQQEIHAIFLALIAKRNVLFIGPPGVAKSSVIQQFIDHFIDVQSFTRLISPTTQPDELFGSAKFDRLREGIIERQIEGHLPTAHFAFLDEIFKSTSDLLNGLLKVMNEHQFDNGTDVIESPLFTLVGASNEFPEADELTALYDRFLLRLEVESLKTPAQLMAMLRSSQQVDVPKLSLQQLASLQQRASQIDVPDATYEWLVDIHFRLKEAGVVVSDRRTKQCVSILKAEALLQNQTCVKRGHFAILKHCLWTEVEDRHVVDALLNEYVLTPLAQAFEKGQQLMQRTAERVAAYAEAEDFDLVEYTTYGAVTYDEWQRIVEEIEDLCGGDRLAIERLDRMQLQMEQLLSKVLV